MSGSIQGLPTASMTVSSGNFGAFPVGFGYYPAEGSRVITAQYNWSSLTGYNEDLSQLVALGVETAIQSVYVDNSTVSQTVLLQVNGTGQLIAIPAYSQGIFPLFLTGTPGYNISTLATNSGVTRVYLLNVPSQAAGVWNSGITYLGAPGQNTPGELAPGQQTPLLSDAYGSLLVDTESQVPAYGTVAFFAPVTSASDIFTIYGSATKTVRIHQISIESSSGLTYYIVRRSSANSGGTFVALNGMKYDINNAAPTATALGYYTANPTTLGTTVGSVDGVTVGGNSPGNLIYGATDQSLVLRGVNDGIAVNINNAGTGTGVAVKIKWTEV